MKSCDNCLHFSSPMHSPFSFCKCVKRVSDDDFGKHLKESDTHSFNKETGNLEQRDIKDVTCKYWRDNQ